MMSNGTGEPEVQIDEPFDPLHIPYQVKDEPMEIDENTASGILVNVPVVPIPADLEIKSEEEDSTECQQVAVEETQHDDKHASKGNLHSLIEIKDESLDTSEKAIQPCSKYENVGTIVKENGKSVFKTMHKCLGCDFTSRSITEIKAHITGHDIKYIEIKHKYKCKSCFKVIATKSGFSKHIKNHEKHAKLSQLKIPLENPKVKECKTSPASLVQESELEIIKKDKKVIERKKRSYNKCTIADMKIYECQLCKNTFKQKHLLLKHSKNVHEIYNSRDLKNDCYICDEKFNNQEPFKEHLLLAHNLTSLKPQCVDCEKIFKNRMTLKEHMKRKHGVNYSGFTCEYCNKHFKYSSLFKLHKIKEHNVGISEVTCDICNMTLECKTLLLQHMKVFHKFGHITLLKCDLCSRKFQSKRNIIKHKVTVHNIGVEYIMCDKCGMTLKSKEHLKEHIQRTHNKVRRSYICEICGKGVFSVLRHLNDHIQGVHKVGAVESKCEICGRVYDCKVYLDSHVKSTHKMKVTEYYKKFGVK